MQVILNSDVIYSQRLIRDSLPAGVERLVLACRERNHIVVIPRTTLLEFERSQSINAGKAIDELEAAYLQLQAQDIHFDRREPFELFPTPNLPDLISSLGADVVVEEPTMEDYTEAHRRACLHEAPHPPNIKSDEMRDLVIWVLSLRLSLADGGAVLVSRDTVHVHERGTAEADDHQLVRVPSIEEALEYLDVRTPAGRLIEELLSPTWPLLREAGLPVGDSPAFRSVSGPEFLQGAFGPVAASARIKLVGTADQPITASVVVDLQEDGSGTVRLTGVTVASKEFSDMAVSLPASREPMADDDRWSSLKEVLGEAE